MLTSKQSEADLTLLDRMYHVPDAGYRCGDRQGCTKGTRRDILFQLENWLNDGRDKRVFWLNGLAGTGKSTIAQTFAEMSFADGKLGASFFCSRDFNDRSNLRTIFPTLAFQLAHQYPRFRQELLPVLTASPDVRLESLCSQMEKLIVGPLQAIQTSTLIIIDALDECQDKEPASALLSVLSRYIDKIPLVKFFITGRPEPRIQSGFRLELLRPRTDVLSLHEVDRFSVDSDIKLFLKAQLMEIAKYRSKYNLTADWPSPQDIDALCEKAAGFFTYASMVIEFVTSKNHTPAKQLKQIISFPQSTAHEGASRIDLLYTQVLDQALDNMGAGNMELHSHFKTVVGAVLLVFNPLSVNALSDLLRVPSVPTTLSYLHSLFLIPASKVSPVCIFHKSFPNFLMDPDQCNTKWFFVDPEVHHTELLLLCLDLMKERLKKNICNLHDYAILTEVEDLATYRTAYIGDALEYACCFWTNHLMKTPSSGPHVEEVQQAINRFFTTHLLFWIEVLSIMGILDAGVYALNNIQQWYTSVSPFKHRLKPISNFVQTGIFCKWTTDSQHFILENFDAIHSSPSLVYHHALPFSPSLSWIHNCYCEELSQEVKVVKGLPAEWGTYPCTVSLDNAPQALACWKDTIAVGLESSDIIILASITGDHISTLSGHSDIVSSLAFSVNGQMLISGSYDETVKLWDMQTSVLIKTFHGHSSPISSVSISPDHTRIAAGFWDGTIQSWDILSEGSLHTTQFYGCKLNVISFSPADSQRLISASGDGTVRQWDVDGLQSKHRCDGYYAVFSSDGAQFMSCGGEVVMLQNSSTGEVLARSCVAGARFQRCCISSDGRFIAAATSYTIHVWDIANSDPSLIATLVGHTESITSLTFSSFLISTSEDKSVKFWWIGISPISLKMAGGVSSPLTPVAIKSISLQAEHGIAISSDSAGMVKTWDLSTGLCNGSFKTTARGKRDVKLVADKLIIVWCETGKIHVLDVTDGRLLQAVDAPGCQIKDLGISEDGSKAFCLTGQSVQAWSILTGEAVGEVKLEDWLQPESLTVDSSSVWVYFDDLPTQGWDFGTLSSSPIPLSNVAPNRPCLNFIDGTKEWNLAPSRVVHTASGKEVFQLPKRYARPARAQWDSQYLVAGYTSGEVLILNFNHMLP